MITYESYGQRDEALGRTWIRTSATAALLSGHADLSDVADIADDVNAGVLAASGVQVCMQANGWAVVPEGLHPEYVAALIDVTVEELQR